MKNYIPTTVTGLVHSGQIAAAGLTDYAAALGLVHIPVATLNLNVGALTTSRDGFNTAKVDYRNAKTAADAMVKSAKAYATLAREILKPHLGNQPSEAFGGAGYGKFAIPRTVPGLIALMQQLSAHFTANEAHENEALNVKASRAATFATDLATVAATVLSKKLIMAQKRLERDAKAKLVRENLQTLYSELRVTLDSTDYLWEKFGFKRPGILQMPGVPLNVTAVLIGPNAVAVKWDRPERGRNYRIWKKVVGVDTEFVLVDSRTDLDFTIEGLPSGATVEIAVSATNNGGESALSEAVTVILPA